MTIIQILGFCFNIIAGIYLIFRAIASNIQSKIDHQKALEMINKYELLNSELEVRLAELNFKLGRKNETRTDHSQS